jgi:adenylate cyclase
METVKHMNSTVGEIYRLRCQARLQDRVAGTKQEMTVLFADIRGFTSLAEQLQPEDCVQILNDYFCLAVDVVLECDGIVDRFQGDSVMATFGSNPAYPDHAYRAVQCAVRLRDGVCNLQIPHMPEKRIRLGIGVNTGVAIVAGVGSRQRLDYTTIGDAVNVAHRLQALSNPDQILISDNTLRRVCGILEVEDLGRLSLKGRTEPINVYAVEQLTVVQ